MFEIPVNHYFFEYKYLFIEFSWLNKAKDSDVLSKDFIFSIC